jgi:hypothetical protein
VGAATGISGCGAHSLITTGTGRDILAQRSICDSFSVKSLLFMLKKKAKAT